MRRAGLEIEFNGLDIDTAAEVLAEALGADAKRRTAVDFRLESPGLGSFRLELDWAYLKARAEAASIGEESPEWVELLKRLSTDIVPLELVCPPIALDRLNALNPAIEALRAAGACGTGDSFLAAFGVHINPELPSLAAGDIERFIRSFGLLQWWLVDHRGVDLSRRLSPYVDLYPEAYVLALATRGGEAELAPLVDHYLAHNPTRNRALDLLPLFKSLDASLLDGRIEDDALVNARPTFHYRLPDCRLEEPGWSLADAWDDWLTIERVAHHPTLLDALSAAFVARDRPLLGVARSDWTQLVDACLCDPGSA